MTVHAAAARGFERGAGRAFRETGKPYEEGRDWAGPIAATGRFGPVERAAVAWDQPMDAELPVQRAASTSFVSALPLERRVSILDRVRDLTATHPDLAGRAAFGFPHDAVLHRCRRRP